MLYAHLYEAVNEHVRHVWKTSICAFRPVEGRLKVGVGAEVGVLGGLGWWSGSQVRGSEVRGWT